MVVFISDAENMEMVLKSKDCLNKPDIFYKRVRDGLKVDGLFTSKGKIMAISNLNLNNLDLFEFSANEWKMHRRIVSPLINPSSLQAYFPIFNNHIRKTVASLPVSKEFIDILPYFLYCTVTMFIETSLGSKLEPNDKQKLMHRFTE